jgi:hypothetical protein
MALKGTLKDLGITDTFQLLGQQGKTGLLVLRDGLSEVRVTMSGGSVVRVECPTRGEYERLGQMMLRAEAVTGHMLDRALKRQLDVVSADPLATPPRLGDALVAAGGCSRETINEFVRIQTMDTLVRLFTWKDGTYEFTQTPPPAVDPQDPVPFRSDVVLMAGLQHLDEWPKVQQAIPTMAAMLEVVRPLPEPRDPFDDDFLSKSSDNVEADLDAAFGLGESTQDSSEPKVTEDERTVYGLVQAGRDVRKVVDLSRLGELAAGRAVASLVEAGYLKMVLPPGMDLFLSDAPAPSPSEPFAALSPADLPREVESWGPVGPPAGVPSYLAGLSIPGPSPPPSLAPPQPGPGFREVTAEVSNEEILEARAAVPAKPRVPLSQRVAALKARLSGPVVALGRGLAWAAGMGVSLAVAGVVAWGALGVDGAAGTVEATRVPATRERLGDHHAWRLRRALEIHRLAHDAYPERLEDLVTGGLLDPGALRGPYDRPYAYQRHGEGYLLDKPFR